MQYINQLIRQLLADEKSVTLTGLGRLEWVLKENDRKASGLPQYELVFNTEVKKDKDTSIESYINSVKTVVDQKLSAAVYLKTIKKELQEKAVYELEGIGLLLSSHEEGIYLIPYHTKVQEINPAKHLRPTKTVSQEEKIEIIREAILEQNPPRVKGIERKKSNLSLYVILILLLGFGAIFIYSNQSIEPTNIAELEKESKELETVEPATVDDSIGMNSIDSSLEISAETPEKESNVEVATSVTPNNPKEAVIIVGVFKDPANLNKLSSKLKAMGFGIYEFKLDNGLTRIGAKVQYKNENELNLVWNKLKRDVQSSAWILE